MAMFSKSMKRASRCSSCALPAKLPPVGSPFPSHSTLGSGAGCAREDPGLGDGGRVTQAAKQYGYGTSIPSGTYSAMMSTAAVNSHDRILLKALELFSDKGYDATSVREICEAAGITKPTLYHFYGSKEGVYRALVEGALERFGADMSRALAGGGTIREQLARMARAYIDAALREPQLSRFLMSLIHSSKNAAPTTDFVGFYQG